VDFHHDIKKGDTFSVVYETLTADGEPITWNDGAGHLLAAEYNNAGRVVQGMWVRGAQGRGAYVGLDGQPKRRSFLASPMEFSRVTSGFAMRMHPILQEMRAHQGVDYGAPVGTPVRSVGDGTVSFAGWRNGYGNVVELQHAGDRSTLYAHLSRIDVRKGEHVDQGAHIGAVGATGWATGPHLHFEFRLHGVYQDPLTVAKANLTPTPPVSRAELAQLASSARTQIAAARSVGSVHNE
jgi:murein DD-endopeptidase MepM/ murein hydrolase activator NlpD